MITKECLRRRCGRTTNDDGRQPMAIGHLSDSGDLKKLKNLSHAFKIHQLVYFCFFVLIQTISASVCYHNLCTISVNLL